MPKLHRAVGGKLDNLFLEAKGAGSSQAATKGSAVVAYATPYSYRDRQITPEVIADGWKIPKIFSSLRFMNYLCFAGVTPHFESIDGPEDDTKQKQIEQAEFQWKRINNSYCWIGKHKACGLVDAIRRTSLEVDSFRSAIWEESTQKIEALGRNFVAPYRVHLPGQSFSRTPQKANTGAGDYQIDGILNGLIYDIKAGEPGYYQSVDSTREPIELDPEAIILIEDLGVPENTSMLHSIMSTVEFLKRSRRNFALAMERVGVPMKVARIDGRELASMKAAGVDIAGGYQTLLAYLEENLITQSAAQVEISLPATRFEYPSVPIPLNPMDVEKFLEQLILAHFFARDILEQLAAAVSTTADPSKNLLDSIIAARREVAGGPHEQDIQRSFLDINGYDLKVWFEYHDWGPKDEGAQVEKAEKLFINGGSLVNDYRAALGEDPYSPEELIELYREQNALKRGIIPGEEAPGEGPESPKAKAKGKPEKAPVT